MNKNPKPKATKADSTKPKGPSSWVFILFLVWLGFALFYDSFVNGPSINIGYSEFLQNLSDKNLGDLLISSNKIDGTLLKYSYMEKGANKEVSNQRFSTIRMTDENLIKRLEENKIKFTVKNENTFWANALVWLLPLGLLFLFWQFYVFAYFSVDSRIVYEFGKKQG